MNTTQYAQGIASVNFAKWLFATILSVAISVFLTLLVGIGSSSWSPSIAAIVLWLVSSLCSFSVQIAIIRSAVPVQVSRWLLYFLFSSMVGWVVSFLLIYLLARPMELLINSVMNSARLVNIVEVGFFVGGVIGLFPGIFIGLAYWRLIRPDDNAKRLFMNNVIGWCLGMGLVSAGILMLLRIALSNMTIF